MSDIERELAELESGQSVANSATSVAKPETEADDDVEYVIREDDPDGDEGDDRDERLSSEQRDDDRESIREARRKERREKRERQKAARDASRYTIDLLSKRLQEAEQRLSAFEGRQVSRESQEVDARLGMAQQAWQIADQARRRAVANSDMAAYDAATRDMQAAEATFNQLRGVKARISQVAAQPGPQEPAPDPRVVGLAQEFADRNDWYDPDGSDEDSAIVQTIDRKLAQEGLDPSTEDYWEELDKRVRRRLPHRFEKQSKPQRQSGPPVGGGREYAPPSTRKEVYVSPERKAAMVAAGAWDNPEKRKAMLKRYAEYDRQNPQR
jgi:hypothetical protein